MHPIGSSLGIAFCYIDLLFSYKRFTILRFNTHSIILFKASCFVFPCLQNCHIHFFAYSSNALIGQSITEIFHPAMDIHRILMENHPLVYLCHLCYPWISKDLSVISCTESVPVHWLISTRASCRCK